MRIANCNNVVIVYTVAMACTCIMFELNINCILASPLFCLCVYVCKNLQVQRLRECAFLAIQCNFLGLAKVRLAHLHAAFPQRQQASLGTNGLVSERRERRERERKRKRET
jgi:hypothetical protein